MLVLANFQSSLILSMNHSSPMAKCTLEKNQEHLHNLKFGFMLKETEGTELHVCAICSAVLANK